MKKWTFIVLLFSLSSIMVLFQNCGSYHSGGDKNNALFSVNAAAFEQKIWSMNKMNITGKAVVLYVNPGLFDEGSLYDWYYRLDGSASGCTVIEIEGYSNAAELTCSNSGQLEVELSIVDSQFKIQVLEYAVQIESAPPPVPADEEIYYSPTEVTVYFDGSINGSGGGGGSGGSPGDPGVSGDELYTTHCGRCHGMQARSSSKRNRSLSSIKSAINSVPTMQGLSSVSDADLQKIVEALAN